MKKLSNSTWTLLTVTTLCVGLTVIGVLRGTGGNISLPCEAPVAKVINEISLIYDTNIVSNQYDSANNHCYFSIEATNIMNKISKNEYNKITHFIVPIKHEEYSEIGHVKINSQCNLPASKYFLFVHNRAVDDFKSNAVLGCRSAFLVEHQEANLINKYVKITR